MDSDDQPIKIEMHPLQQAGQALGLITLNRPEDMNPLNADQIVSLGDAVVDLSKREGVRVIAITGAGKAFSAGGDLKAYMSLFRDADKFRKFLNDVRTAHENIVRCAQPVIALVNGYCVAGGLELLLACDLAYASASAKIGDGHVKFGQVGGAGSNVRLLRWMSPAKAKELLFTGKLLSAYEALELGLVNRVVPDGGLLEAAIAFANEVAMRSPLGIREIKMVCNKSLAMNLDEALDAEMEVVHRYATQSRDAYEGLIAFSEKRSPVFVGS